MSTRISYGRSNGRGSGGRGRPVAPVQVQGAQAPEQTGGGGCSSCCPGCASLTAPFCETVTLHESFDASCLSPSCVRICYDTNFLGYTLDEYSVQAQLPGGGCCPVDVLRVSLTGAIPYLISAGPIRSSCGDDTTISCQGVCMVDQVIGYLCNEEDPDLESLDCGNVTPTVDVDVDRCGCSGKTNLTFRGVFTFSDLPTTLP